MLHWDAVLGRDNQSELEVLFPTVAPLFLVQGSDMSEHLNVVLGDAQSLRVGDSIVHASDVLFLYGRGRQPNDVHINQCVHG